MRQTRKYTSKTHLFYEIRNKLQINRIWKLLQVCMVDVTSEILRRNFNPITNTIEDGDRLPCIKN